MKQMSTLKSPQFNDRTIIRKLTQPKKSLQIHVPDSLLLQKVTSKTEESHSPNNSIGFIKDEENNDLSSSIKLKPKYKEN